MTTENIDNKPLLRQSFRLDVYGLVDVIRDRYQVILGITLLFLLMGGLYLSTQKSQYTATAMIQLKTSERQLMDSELAMTGRIQDNAAVQSELDILKSPALMRRVVEKLGLSQTPEFNAALRPQGAVTKLKSLAGARKSNKESPGEITLIKVTAAARKNLSLKKDPLSYTVYISFTSQNAQRAKIVANAIADEYLAYRIESQAEAGRRAKEWYSARANELRQNVILAERVVQEFSEKHNLFEVDGATLGDQQISELNTQLVEARTARAQIDARAQSARKLIESGSNVESVSEVLNSFLIQRLREKEAELLRQKSELSGHFGPRHPTMEKITGEIRDLRSKIKNEIGKILQGLENEVEIAKAREESLKKQLETMQGQMGDSTRIQLMELKREAEASRVLYESFLSRAKESREAEALDQALAKIISRAELPLTPSHPRKGLIITFFLISGLFGGIALALTMEHYSVGFISPAQVEETLGILNVGMVPEISGENRLMNYAVQNPSSVYAESLRSIMANLEFSDRAKPPRSVVVLSALPQEGKGWLAVSLARVAALSGRKVLLLDCDLHRAMVSDVFDAQPVHTLNDYLDGTVSLKDVINTDPETGMHFISSIPDHGHAQELLESNLMKELIEHGHREYDIVIVDSPPVIGLSDVLFLSKLVDTTVLAVRWGKTPRHVVRNALRILSRSHVNLAGAILTRMPLEQYKRHEFGGANYYKQYGDYYHEGPLDSRKVVNIGKRS